MVCLKILFDRKVGNLPSALSLIFADGKLEVKSYLGMIFFIIFLLPLSFSLCQRSLQLIHRRSLADQPHRAPSTAKAGVIITPKAVIWLMSVTFSI